MSPRPLLPLSRRGQASKISDLPRGGLTCELQGGARHNTVVLPCGAAGKVRSSTSSPRNSPWCQKYLAGHATLTGPDCTFDWQWTRPQQRGRRMQTGISLSCALDPPGRLSALVHTATVDSLPSGHRYLSGPLHFAAAALLPTVRHPRRLVSCCILLVIVVVTLSQHQFPDQSRRFLSICAPPFLK